MAYRDTADLLKAQIKLTGKAQSTELRYINPDLYFYLMQNGQSLIPNYQTLRTREDRPIELLFRARNKRTVTQGNRSYTHSGDKGKTATVSPTWTTYKMPFAISMKQAGKSNYSLQEQLNDEIENVSLDFIAKAEELATNYVFANRTGVNVATAKGTFDAADDVFKILDANKSTAILITEVMMKANAYGKDSVIVCDSISYMDFMHYANQGGANNTNTSFQFNGVTFIHSQTLGSLFAGLVGAYSKGCWVVIPNGTVGITSWIPQENRKGVNNKVATYTSMVNPIDNDSYAVHIIESGTDDTSSNGYYQDTLENYEVSIDWGFMKVPLTVANETPIYAVAIV